MSYNLNSLKVDHIGFRVWGLNSLKGGYSGFRIGCLGSKLLKGRLCRGWYEFRQWITQGRHTSPLKNVAQSLLFTKYTLTRQQVFIGAHKDIS